MSAVPEPVPALPTPAALPAGCVRCGGFDVSGPAADVGFRLCAACFAWEPARRTRPRTAPVAIGALAIVGLFASWVIEIALEVAATMSRAPAAAIMLAALGAPLLLGLGVVFFFARGQRRWVRESVEALKLDPARLRESAGAGALVEVVYYAIADEVRLGITRTDEVALLGASARGVLIYGPAMRAAIPWRETDLKRVNRYWIRLSRPGGHHHVRPPTYGAIARLLVALQALRDAARAPAAPPGV
jgi:hypothetical protein